MKNTILSIIATTILITGTYFLTHKNESIDSTPIQNVTTEKGNQIITITAKGGFLPRKSIAKAGVPTILRFDTHGTFDCSSSVRIPSLGISETLPPSGSTDISLGIQNTGTVNGTCGMGMYPFVIEFQS